MALTGQLGTSESFLGNLLLGIGSEATSEDVSPILFVIDPSNIDLLAEGWAATQREADAFFEGGVPFFVGVFADAGPVTPVAGTAAYPNLVMIDQKAQVRSRQHQQQVADILNSFIRKGVIQQTSAKEFQLGYDPADPQAWGPDRPTTIAEALDILISLL